MNKFRLLRGDEIEVRVQSYIQSQKACILLLYKDARCDMNILDETVGEMNWERKHQEINGNLFTDVCIYDKDKSQWVCKQDVGVESNTEATKGQASDSFKRACFNWGIGRELYTSPFIYIKMNDNEIDKNKNKVKSNVKFSVKEIEYENNKISKLVIIDKNNKVRFSTNNNNNIKEEIEMISETKIKLIKKLLKGKVESNTELTTSEQKNGEYTRLRTIELYHFNVKDLNELTKPQAEECIKRLTNKK